MLPTSRSRNVSSWSKSDGVRRAELLARLARPAFVEGAIVAVDHRELRYGLREGAVDRLAVAHPGLEDLVDDLARALLDADAAAGAVLLIHAARLLADADVEVADEARDLLDLGIAQQGDLVVRPDVRHLGRQDAGRAVQGGEGLVELRHVAADGRLALDHVDGVTGVGQLEGRLDAGDAAADDQRVGVDRYGRRLELLLQLDAAHGAGDQRLGLFERQRFVLGHPRDLLAEVRHLHQIRVQAGGWRRHAGRSSRAGGASTRRPRRASARAS